MSKPVSPKEIATKFLIRSPFGGFVAVFPALERDEHHSVEVFTA